MSDATPKDYLNPDNWTVGPEYDPFNKELDTKYPIDKMLSEENLEAVSKGLPPMNWVSILRNSPANKGESEIMMGQFLTLAARAGQWVDMPPIPDENLGSFSVGDLEVDLSGVRLEFGEGKEILKKIGFVNTVVDDDGHEMVKPLEPMIQFFKDRLQNQYGPKT